jgi:TonB family protein
VSHNPLHNKHLSPSDFEAYLSASLSDKDMHRIERHLLECEFCNEALVGYSEKDQDLIIEDEIAEINSLITARSKKKRKVFPLFRIAAIAIVLIAAGFFVANYMIKDSKRMQFSEKRVKAPKVKKGKVNGTETRTDSLPDFSEKDSSEKITNTDQKKVKGVNTESKEASKEKETEIILDQLSTIKMDDTVLSAKEAESYAFTSSIPAENSMNEQVIESKNEQTLSDTESYIQGKTIFGRLNGLVTDELTGEPLPYVEVELTMNDILVMDTVTDQYGKFTLDQIEADKYDVAISSEGYSKAIVTNVEIDPDQETYQNFNLNAGYDLETFEIVSDNPPLIDRDAGPSGATISSEDIHKLPLRNVADMPDYAASSGSSNSKRAKSYDAATETLSNSDPEKMPLENKNAEPIIGFDLYEAYLLDSLQYPTEALENNIKGKVVIQFSVSEKGEISDFIILKRLGYGCDEEAIRLIKEGSRWNSAYLKGNPVEDVVKVKVLFK